MRSVSIEKASTRFQETIRSSTVPSQRPRMVSWVLRYVLLLWRTFRQPSAENSRNRLPLLLPGCQFFLTGFRNHDLARASTTQKLFQTLY
nr:unnamed protein product [Callosobruchus chinensis]